jgi:hypothetical protein
MKEHVPYRLRAIKFTEKGKQSSGTLYSYIYILRLCDVRNITPPPQKKAWKTKFKQERYVYSIRFL